MKRLARLSILVIILSTGANGLRAQGNVVKANPLSLFLKTLNVQYERKLSDFLSVQLGVFGGKAGIGKDNTGSVIQNSWLGITPEVRYYLNGANRPAPEGFYMAAYLRHRRIRAQYLEDVQDPVLGDTIRIDVTARINSTGGGALFGYQFIFGGGFNLDVYGGIQFSLAKFSFNAEAAEHGVDFPGLPFGGPGIRAGLSLGYAF